ncbi:Cysteine-rich secretory protein 3 [Mactra antiquata]
MYPGHSAATQNSSPPYKYSLSSTKYGCESNITITLYTNDVKGFKGFLCQTRRDLNEYRTYGTLTSNNTVYTINKCNQTGSISHSNPTIKSSVTFIWTPPVIDVGELSIICTVVKEFSIFWMNVVSPAITYSACPTSTNTPLSTSLSSRRTNSTPSSTQTSSVSTTASETLSTPVQTTPNTSKSPNISSTFTSKTITTSADLTTTETTSVNSASTFSEATSVRSPYCRDIYEARKGHTMCSGTIRQRNIHDKDRDEIEQLHNTIRSSVSPPAANMMKLEFSQLLEKEAQLWAELCTMSHDQNDLRFLPNRFSVGQNIAIGGPTLNWTDVILNIWGQEKTQFTYGGPNNVSMVKNYTQMVWANTFLFGCGVSKCGVNYFYVCNYASSMDETNIDKPYINSTTGRSCDSCMAHCDNVTSTLCDCLGKLCLNGGILNLDTCTCSCITEVKTYDHEYCELYCQTNGDDPRCGKLPYVASTCQNDTQTTFHCPWMCNICPYADRNYTESSVLLPWERGLPMCTTSTVAMSTVSPSTVSPSPMRSSCSQTINVYGGGSVTSNPGCYIVTKPPTFSCLEKYQVVGDHIYCQLDPRISHPTDPEMKEIAKVHNDVRSVVNPPAADMVQVEYSKGNERPALIWTQMCQDKIFSQYKRFLPGYTFMGLNTLVSSKNLTWTEVVNVWLQENSTFTYGGSNDPKLVSNFTQIIWSKTSVVGCAKHVCSSNEVRYACSYAPGLEVGDINKPYTQDVSSCSACPFNCTNGLCDCNGILCLNGGTQDLDTCTCTCPTGNNLYEGLFCELYCIPNGDDVGCGSKYPKNTCTTSRETAFKCPWMCDFCPYAGKNYTRNSVPLPYQRGKKECVSGMTPAGPGSVTTTATGSSTYSTGTGSGSKQGKGQDNGDMSVHQSFWTIVMSCFVFLFLINNQYQTL